MSKEWDEWDDLPWLDKDPAPAVPSPPPRKREGRVTATPSDPVVVRRNKLNRQRGKGTSAELARYLGFQNVEGMNWKHDVQGPGARIQSKRDGGRSDTSAVAVISAIGPGDWLRALFHVKPRQRLSSGVIVLRLDEWVAERGWGLPPQATIRNANPVPVIVMPVSLFRDLVVSTLDKPASDDV